MHRAHRSLFAYVDARALEVLGVSASQLGGLYYVAAHEGCSPSEVAATLDLNKSAVSAMVRRMERAGVVRRAAHPSDGRSTLLYATPKGHEVRAQSLRWVRRLTADILDGFDEREVQTIFRFLNSIVDRYGDADGQSEA